ncbi:MAG: acetolactate synthase-1/3 small subunit [Candidatus Poriferisodalaceae bacterium]|jgi:acetolactate synthase I/III small subunit
MTTALGQAAPDLHILAVLVENKFGVLARIAGLFSRRGFNIFSLAVAPTDDEAVSRITIVVDVHNTDVTQIAKQLNKLINVLEISELQPAMSVQRELMLAHLDEADDKAGLTAVLDQFGGIILEDDGTGEDASHAVISVSASPARLDECETMLRAYGIVELQRTGRIALPRLDHS